ncbi:MAG: hypothetical protein AAFV53_27645 [Myxococcota bacterium]
MYNLLISVAISVALFGVGFATTGEWVAGVIPGTIALGVTYFLLMRRTGRQLEVIMNTAMGEFQKMQQPMSAEQQRINEQHMARGKEILESGLALAPWQFLIAEQIEAQLGSLAYMKMDYAAARPHLEKSWTRNWQAQTMLALLDFREGKNEDALARLGKQTGNGGKDPTFWAVYATVAYRAKEKDIALRAINEGLEKNEGSDLLQTLADQLRNKKPLTPEMMGQPWLQFFPEDARKVMAANPSLAPQQPLNRAQRRALKRGKKLSDPNLNHPRY